MKSSHKHLDIYKSSFLFDESLKSYGSLYFTTFLMKSICHTIASFGTPQTKLIEPVFQRFYKDVLLSKIAVSLALQKGRNNATSFESQVLRKSLGLFSEALFEYITVRTNFLKNLICSTFCVKLSTFSAIFNNKRFGNFKEWMTAILSVTKTDTLLQEIGGCNWSGEIRSSKKVVVVNKYLLQKIIYQMAATAPLKKLSYKKEMAQADIPKEANTVKKLMACRYYSHQIN